MREEELKVNNREDTRENPQQVWQKNEKKLDSKGGKSSEKDTEDDKEMKHHLV